MVFIIVVSNSSNMNGRNTEHVSMEIWKLISQLQCRQMKDIILLQLWLQLIFILAILKDISCRIFSKLWSLDLELRLLFSAKELMDSRCFLLLICICRRIWEALLIILVGKMDSARDRMLFIFQLIEIFVFYCFILGIFYFLKNIFVNFWCF